MVVELRMQVAAASDTSGLEFARGVRGADSGIGCPGLKRASLEQRRSVASDSCGMPRSRMTRRRYSRGASGVRRPSSRRSASTCSIRAYASITAARGRPRSRSGTRPRRPPVARAPHRRGAPPEPARSRVTRRAVAGVSAPPPPPATEARQAPADAHELAGDPYGHPDDPGGDDRPEQPPQPGRRPRRPEAIRLRGVYVGRQLARNRIVRRDHADLDQLAAARYVPLLSLADRPVAGDRDDAHQHREHDHGGCRSNGRDAHRLASLLVARRGSDSARAMARAATHRSDPVTLEAVFIMVGVIATWRRDRRALDALTTEHFTLQGARSRRRARAPAAPRSTSSRSPAPWSRWGSSARHRRSARLRCLRPHRPPDALCPRHLHLRASGRVRCRGLPLRRRYQPDPQLLSRSPVISVAPPALRARRAKRPPRRRRPGHRAPRRRVSCSGLSGSSNGRARAAWQRTPCCARCWRRSQRRASPDGACS